MTNKNAVLINPTDTVVSLGDLAYAGTLLMDSRPPEHRLIMALASLSHLLTAVVLSERILVIGHEDNMTEPPSSLMYSLLKKHCRVLNISLTDEALTAGAAVWNNPVKEFGTRTCAVAFESEHRLVTGRPLPEPTRMFISDLLDTPGLSSLAFDALPLFQGVRATLAEYSISQALSLPFAPNPVLSVPILLNELRANTAKEDLVRLVDEMRHETATLYDQSRAGATLDLHRNANIYCLRLPAILMSIINQSKSLPEAVKIAADISKTSEAAAFRNWCKNMETLVDPKTYVERLQAARVTLERLGRTIDTGAGSELTVTPGPLGIQLPVPSIKRAVQWANVDVQFVRPRRFLLNMLSQARQMNSVDEKLANILGVDRRSALNAAALFVKSSEEILDANVKRIH